MLCRLNGNQQITRRNKLWSAVTTAHALLVNLYVFSIHYFGKKMPRVFFFYICSIYMYFLTCIQYMYVKKLTLYLLSTLFSAYFFFSFFFDYQNITRR